MRPNYNRGGVGGRSLAAALPNAAPYSLVASNGNTREAYRDLLIFEERLKQNSQRLASQRRKYEAFLLSLILSIISLAYRVFLAPSPYTLIQSLNSGLLLIGIVTLILFFATGVYSEKIAYAYKFVPQANRALRYFNIYLNTKKPPRFWSLNPFRLFRGQRAPVAAAVNNADGTPLVRTLSTTTVSRSSRGSSSSSSISSARSRSPYGGSSSRGNAVPLAPLPPASNPRGELIFSSKVSPAYREGYEKYRSDWEKRRRRPTTSHNDRGELSWTTWLASYFRKTPMSVPQSQSASSTTDRKKTNHKKTNSSDSATAAASGSISYAASPSEYSDSSLGPSDVNSATASSRRGRDVSKRPLTRTGSSSSISSSAFSISPPVSRGSSPLRNSTRLSPSATSSTSPNPLSSNTHTQAAEITTTMTSSSATCRPNFASIPTNTSIATSASSNPSSRASTPDLIREDDEYLNYYPHNGINHHNATTEGQHSSILVAAAARRRRQWISTSTSDTSLASSSSRSQYMATLAFAEDGVDNEQGEGDDDDDDALLPISPPDMSPPSRIKNLPIDSVQQHGKERRARASSFNEFLEELREQELEGH